MPCHACNPYCGNCKPPKERPRLCPACGKLVFPEDASEDRCPACGNELAPRVRPKTVFCHNSGLLCANPCGKAKAPNPRKVYVACPWNTPPDKSKQGPK